MKEQRDMQDEAIRTRQPVYYSMSSIVFKRENPQTRYTFATGTQYALIAVTAGHGRMVLAGTGYPLRQGSCMLIGPACSSRLEAEEGGLSYYRLGFEAIAAVKNSEALPRTGSLPAPGALECSPFSQGLLLLDALYRQREAEDELEVFENQVRFEELLLFLFKQNRAAGYEQRTRQAVLQSIEELEHNYAQAFTVDQLAIRAGTNRAKYTQMFKDLTEQLPLEYLNGLRIEKAQQLLLLSQDKLVDIANAVGFNDEYYFNRRFKQEVGVTPGQFRRHHRNPDRIFAPFLEDFLMALGITPAVQFSGKNWGKQGYLAMHAVPEFDVTTGDWQALSRFQPEMILLDGGYRRWNLDKYKRVAPVFRLPSTSEDWRSTLHAIAVVFGVQDRAAEVIGSYERLVETARERLGGLRRQRQRVAVLRVSAQSILLYGGDGRGYTGPILYGDLGLAEPALVREMEERRVEISPEALARLDADHVFVAFDNSEGDGRKLVDSPHWQTLSAVRNGCVHEVDFWAWMNYGVLSHMRKIEDVLKALA
jgi:ABC-type Fe3+-hydroxamate transport system substrate-binding protein/AraC-like DNA-binding protein